MKPTWIIEHVFADDCERLINSLQKTNTDYCVVSDPIYEGKWKLYPPEQCVITYGSIQFGYLVHREAQWIPGHYCTSEHYRCSVYYNVFGDLLLNYNYFMLPFSELLSKEKLIYGTMGIDDTVFIRPDSGNKTFTGKAVYRSEFEKDYDIFSMYEPRPEDMCLISEPRNITHEWRFFVVDNEIVSGSLYKPDHKTIECSANTKWRGITKQDNLALDLAKRAVKKVPTYPKQNDFDAYIWWPDPAWCIDICRTKHDNYYVLEIGSFSSAGLYHTDTDLLVPAVNAVALKEYDDCFTI